jgi:hypothetical protein
MMAIAFLSLADKYYIYMSIEKATSCLAYVYYQYQYRPRDCPCCRQYISLTLRNLTSTLASGFRAFVHPDPNIPYSTTFRSQPMESLTI